MLHINHIEVLKAAGRYPGISSRHGGIRIRHTKLFPGYLPRFGRVPFGINIWFIILFSNDGWCYWRLSLLRRFLFFRGWKSRCIKASLANTPPNTSTLLCREMLLDSTFLCVKTQLQVSLRMLGNVTNLTQSFLWRCNDFVVRLRLLLSCKNSGEAGTFRTC